MKFDPTFLVTLLAGAVPIGSVAAFFLYVSPLTIISVATIVMALMIVFGLGILAGQRSEADGRPERE